MAIKNITSVMQFLKVAHLYKYFPENPPGFLSVLQREGSMHSMYTSRPACPWGYMTIIGSESSPSWQDGRLCIVPAPRLGCSGSVYALHPQAAWRHSTFYYHHTSQSFSDLSLTAEAAISRGHDQAHLHSWMLATEFMLCVLYISPDYKLPLKQPAKSQYPCPFWQSSIHVQ